MLANNAIALTINKEKKLILFPDHGKVFESKRYTSFTFYDFDLYFDELLLSGRYVHTYVCLVKIMSSLGFTGSLHICFGDLILCITRPAVSETPWVDTDFIQIS